VLLIDHESINESGYRLREQTPPPLVSVAHEVGEPHLLQMDIAAQGGEEVVEDRRPGAHLESFDIADLLDRAVRALDSPVRVAESVEVGGRK
jgi:hypothetical protein